MSVSRKTAEDFRARVNNGLPAQLLRNQPGAVCGSIWTLAAEALEQLAKAPRPGLVERLKSRVAELGFAVRDLERERDKPPPATVTDVIWRQEAIRRAEQVRTLEAIVSRALDLASDYYDPDADPVLQALADELHRAGLYDAQKGEIKPAGHALQLRAATTAPAPAPWVGALQQVSIKTLTPYGEANSDNQGRIVDAFRPLRVYVAGGSSEVGLVAEQIDTLRQAGVEITHDWTLDVLRWRAAGSPSLTAEQCAAHARADLDGIERADLVWWILPAAKSEGAALEVGVAMGRGKRIMVSGSVAFDLGAGRAVFPSMIPERWESHEAALAAIVSRAAERRKGGVP